MHIVTALRTHGKVDHLSVEGAKSAICLILKVATFFPYSVRVHLIAKLSRKAKDR
jgi:hypothetical protein